ncbi:hypothetical protein D3C72_1976060 [compost metagenome]
MEHPALFAQPVDVGREVAAAQAADVLGAQALLQDDHHIQRLVPPDRGLLFMQARVARVQRRALHAGFLAHDGVHLVYRHLRIHRRGRTLVLHAIRRVEHAVQRIQRQ